MNIIVGTAGHIDHGKTALIKALTGTDTDRLPEEKKRGITIDLGFAELTLGEHRIGFVDVPGHERFVKNMLAGASGIDLVLLVIAADEGVMPQTREHFDICRLLGVQNGLVVLTKKDLVDEELLELVRLEAAELVEGSFLQGAPVVAVSSKTGEGIIELKDTLTRIAKNVTARHDDMVTRLPIDRSFTVKGFGTVVTGTLASGSIKEGVEMELMPTGRSFRVRGLQTHGKETKSASGGQRVAVNLAGVDQDEIERGMTLSEPGTLKPIQIFDAQIEVLKSAPRPVRSRQRVRVHIGTAEVLARVHVINAAGEIAPGSTDLGQLRLETPVTAVMTEAFIIRSYSPQTTIAGGTVIDPLPLKHRTRDTAAARLLLENLIEARENRDAVIRLLVESSADRGVDFKQLQSRTGWRTAIIEDAISSNVKNGSIIDAGGHFLASANFAELKQKTVTAVEEHHKREPLSKGMVRETLREKVFAKIPAEIFRAVLTGLEKAGKLTVGQDIVSSPSHSQTLTAEETALVAKLRQVISAAGLEPPKIEEAVGAAVAGTKISPAQAQKLVQLSVNNGELVRVSGEFCFERGVIESLARKVRNHAAGATNRLIDVPTFKDLAGVSRKYAIPLLEYFDRVGVTKRAGDKRIVV